MTKLLKIQQWAINIFKNTNHAQGSNMASSDNIHWLIKALSAIGIFLFFEFGYIWASKGHQTSDIINGTLPIDHVIPLIPEFIIPYMLGYLFVLIPIFLFNHKQDYYRGVFMFIFTLSIAFILFKIFPVHMSKTYALGSDSFSQLTYFQQKNDTSFNNCPSLHVTLNLYCWGLLLIKFGKKMLWLAWIPAAIIISTLFVKQHLVIDVVGGILLGSFSSYLFYRLKDYPAFSHRAYQASILLVIITILINLDKLNLVWKILWGFLQSGGDIIAFTAVLFAIILVIGIMLKNRQQNRESHNV